MFGSKMLEVAIGVVFVYLVVSLLCSAVREGIEAWTKTRAAYLEYGIRELLNDKAGTGLAARLFNHPLIAGLYSNGYTPGRSDRRPGLLERGNHLPSYVPAKNFALALMDMAARGTKTDEVSSHPAAPALSLMNVRANILNLENAAVQRVLLTAIDSAEGDLTAARANLEAWYDSAMERIGGWYKRSTQWILFWIALIIVIGGNFNTLAIATYLYRHEAARAALASSATTAAGDPDFLAAAAGEAVQALADMNLPIGWQGDAWARLADDVVGSVLGWLLTAVAATLGAPFWFDVLKKIMVVRTTLKPDAREAAKSKPASDSVEARDAGAQGNAAPRASAPARAPMVRDEHSDVDACENRAGDAVDDTLDEDLPAATGGVR